MSDEINTEDIEVLKRDLKRISQDFNKALSEFNCKINGMLLI